MGCRGTVRLTHKRSGNPTLVEYVPNRPIFIEVACHRSRLGPNWCPPCMVSLARDDRYINRFPLQTGGWCKPASALRVDDATAQDGCRAKQVVHGPSNKGDVT